MHRFVVHIRAMKQDCFSKDGADALAATIEAFWRDKGAPHVSAWAYALPSGDWGVRSNLVAGKPPYLR